MMPLLAMFGLRRSWVSQICWLSLALFFLPSPALAIDVATPFSVSNSSPLVQIYGLPEIGRAFLFEKGQGQVEFSLQVANNFLTHTSAMEELHLDGESYRYRLRWELTPLDNLELGLEIPYLHHDGGFLDRYIDDFHRTFGFSRGDRALSPNDQLRYRYRSGAQTLLDFNSSERGLGDLRLSGAWQLLRQPDAAVALRGSLKLPTGKSERLTGSGGTDLALWFSGAKNLSTDLGPVSLFGSFGGLWLGDSDVLSDLQRHLVGFGGLGAGWSPRRWLKLQVQVDLHTAFYQNTNLKVLGEEAAILTMGGVFALSQQQELEFAVVEDIAVETAPDVAFHLAWRYRY